MSSAQKTEAQELTWAESLLAISKSELGYFIGSDEAKRACEMMDEFLHKRYIAE